MRPILRLHELDLLRGLACLAVVAFHFLSRGPRSGDMPGATMLFDPVSRYGYLGVHLFFLISGFVILMSAQGVSARRFLASRMVRLYPALWAAATVTTLTAWIVGSRRYSVELPEYLANLTMINHWLGVDYVDGSYWSLSFELHFYLLMAAVIFFGMIKHIHWLYLGWLAISVVNLVRPMHPVQFWLAAHWAPLFVAGGMFFLIRNEGANRRNLLILGCSLLLAIAYAVKETATLSVRTGAPFSPVVAVLAILSFFAVFALISCDRWSMKGNIWTYMAGILTYPVYLLHQHFGFMLYDLFRSSVGELLAFVFMCAAIVFVACAVRGYVERPSNHLFRRLKQRFAPSAMPAV